MRKSLAILFLMLFSFQVLPLKVIGKLWNPGSNIEEVQGGNEEGPDGKATKFSDDHIVVNYVFDLFATDRGFKNKLLLFIHKTESISSVPVSERPSQPPDHLFRGV